MQTSSRRLRAAVGLIVTMVLLVGCGREAARRRTAPEPQSPQSSLPVTPAAPSPQGPSTFRTEQFKPAFSVRLPGGWTAVERADDAMQMYVGCSTCTHDGEENGEITLDMTLAQMSPSKAIARLQKADNIVSEPVRKVRVAGHSAFEFIATRTGKAEVQFPPLGLHSEAEGKPIQVFAFEVGGRTVSLFIDPHEAQGTAASDFMRAALAIVNKIRFES